MKKIVLAAVASLLCTTPALAQTSFSGPRVGATVGVLGDDIFDSDATSFGLEVGYDHDFGNGAVVGIQGEYQDDFDGDFGHELAATARVGGKAGQNALVYVAGGYSRIEVGNFHLDGVRTGLGVEFGLGASGASLKVEQRYGNYEAGAELFQTVVGVGFRF